MDKIKEFVPYTESMELKELGFDEYCFGFWDSYNGGTHFFLKPRSKPYWWIKLFNPQPDITEYSQGLLEYEEGPNAVLAPTFSQAFRWFREKYELYDTISKNGYMIEGELNNEFLRITKLSLKSHEEAEIECLRKLIEIVKNK